MWPVGYDAHAYWAARLDDPYALELAGVVPDAFRYSPAALQVAAPLRLLPFPAFLGLWTMLEVVALVYICGPLTLLVVLLPPVWLELVVGNVNLLLAAAIVVGFRFPAAWAFVILTKVTPGVGVLWFAFRREWRSLGFALGATAIVTIVSVLLGPGLWADWIAVLSTNAARGVPPEAYIAVPLLVRLPLALIVLAWGAVNDQRWTVPVAAFLALPTIWESTLSMLVAVIPLAPWQRLAERFGSNATRQLAASLERT